jgi:hypothetical protein
VTDAAFIRYLSSKRTVDDRALNRRVGETLLARVTPRPRVLELGGGIGTMVERVTEDGRLAPRSWTLVDAQPALIAEARRRLAGAGGPTVELVAQDLDGFLRAPGPGADLVVANAFLDLFDVPSVLPRLLPLAAARGLFWFTINFDGVTIMEPVIDPGLDARIMDSYHRSMDERVTDDEPSGDSRSGRHLLSLLPRCGYRVLDAGASDWIVMARDGVYPADEAYFLECILGFFEESVGSRAEVGAAELREWLAVRRAQVRSGELIFLAHQLDVLAAPA